VLDELDGPYAYSDLTGLQLRNATNPVGYWETVFEGCEEGSTRWARLVWDLETPPGTTVSFQVRTGDDLEGLASAPWTEAATVPADSSPFELQEVLGDGPGDPFLGVRVNISSEVHGATPVVHRVGVLHSCPGGFS